MGPGSPHAIKGALLGGLAVGAEDVDDLVLIELLHLVTGGTEVLAGIKLAGLLIEDLADGGRASIPKAPAPGRAGALRASNL